MCSQGRNEDLFESVVVVGLVYESESSYGVMVSFELSRTSFLSHDKPEITPDSVTRNLQREGSPPDSLNFGLRAKEKIDFESEKKWVRPCRNCICASPLSSSDLPSTT